MGQGGGSQSQASLRYVSLTLKEMAFGHGGSLSNAMHLKIQLMFNSDNHSQYRNTMALLEI